MFIKLIKLENNWASRQVFALLEFHIYLSSFVYNIDTYLHYYIVLVTPVRFYPLCSACMGCSVMFYSTLPDKWAIQYNEIYLNRNSRYFRRFARSKTKQIKSNSSALYKRKYKIDIDEGSNR